MAMDQDEPKDWEDPGPMRTGTCLPFPSHLILFSSFIEMVVPPEHSALSLRPGCVVLTKVCGLWPEPTA